MPNDVTYQLEIRYIPQDHWEAYDSSEYTSEEAAAELMHTMMQEDADHDWNTAYRIVKVVREVVNTYEPKEWQNAD